jgi:hypothetical protein
MKHRHAAALALVGWYMMVPPFSDTAPYANVNSEAPISCWDQTGKEFASQAICEEFIKKAKGDSRSDPNLRKNFERKFGKFGGPSWGQMLLVLESARCVSTDDPRLKAKNDCLPDDDPN